MDKIYETFFKATMVAFIFVVGIQIGIQHGRSLEREEFVVRVKTLKEAIRMLEEENQALKARIEELRIDLDRYRIREAVIACESSYRSDARRGKAYGILQIKPSTWKYFLKISGLKGLDYKLPLHQIKIFDWIFKNRPDLLNHWECYQKVAKTRKEVSNG